MREESSRTHDVFLSYSSKDKTWADAACAVLERHHVRCWIAPRDITPGDEWGAAIIKGLNGSRMMVLIFSGHANASGQVRREVERAISQGITVLPIRIEDVQPEGAMEFALGNRHWLDAFTPPIERQMELLARSVMTHLSNDVASAPGPAPTSHAAVALPESPEGSRVTGDEPTKTKVKPRTDPTAAGESRRPVAFWLIAVATSLIGLGALGVIMIAIKSRSTETETTVPDDSSHQVVPTGPSVEHDLSKNDPASDANPSADASGIGRSSSTTPPGPRLLRKPVASTELLTLIRDDLDSRVKSERQPFQRYFSLAHLAGDPAIDTTILQRNRDALFQLVHSLAVRESTTPQPIDSEQLVFRVDIQASGWNAKAFRHELHRDDPYALQYPADAAGDQLRNVAHDVERRLDEAEDHLPAYVRVDWFLITFTDPQRARAFLELTPSSPEEIDERLQSIAALRKQSADLVALYDRPLDLAAASRELGVADVQEVRQAILRLPDLRDDKLGLKPLTEGKTIGRGVWSFSAVEYSTYGQLCRQLKLGRRLLVR